MDADPCGDRGTVRHDPLVVPVADPAAVAEMSPAGAGLAALTRVLWAHRLRAEALLYRLSVARLLLLADNRAHAARALAEAGDAATALRQAEGDRVREVCTFAATRSLPPDQVTLPWLAGAVPATWTAVFADHLAALCRLIRDIEHTAGHDLMLVEQGLDDIRRSAAAVRDPDWRQELELQVVGYRTGREALQGVLPPTLDAFVATGGPRTGPSAARTD